MKKILALFIGGVWFLGHGSVLGADHFTESLAGDWRFALDRADAGLNEQWFTRDLPDKIKLPGALQSQGYGDEIGTNTPWVLSLYDRNWFLRADCTNYAKPGDVKVPFVCQPPRHYLGAAWYQRDLEIPAEWQGRRTVLFLERPHWETRVWLDDKLIGTNNSLCTPHEFDFGIVAPGKHRLTVRVDNRLILPYRPDAHSVSDSLGQSWNGIVGAMELRSTPPVWIESVQVFPDLGSKSARVKLTIGNSTGKAGSGVVTLFERVLPFFRAGDPIGNEGSHSSPGHLNAVNWDLNGAALEMNLPLGEPVQIWDEFEPACRSLSLEFTNDWGTEFKHLVFGARDFRAAGHEFTINGRPTYLRGTHHGGDFPLTGYPPCDVQYWRKLFATCKEWGLNHVRFHSFCPPDAAFTAADELGIYLCIEPGMWNTFNPNSPMEAMLYAETGRILKYYGNHPSFVLFSPSNEPKGKWRDVLPQWADHFRAADPRRLYTSGTGFTDPDAPGPLDKVDFTTVQRFGSRQVRGASGWFGGDYSRALSGVHVPVIAHELGQWCAYPDFDVIKKFTGYARPGNYEVFRDSAAASGVLDYNKQFALASGRFQFACYKEEIEANLRTPGLAGFQLLDLHDYTGQGTALVGVLDPFWESKGYGTPEEWRRFCSPIVPLARLTKRAFTTAEEVELPVGLANFSGSTLSNAFMNWSIRSKGDRASSAGSSTFEVYPVGLSQGKISAKLTPEMTAKMGAPLMCQLRVGVGTYPHGRGSGSNRVEPSYVGENVWTLWLYPAQVSAAVPPNVFVTSSWPEAETKLAIGGRVLFLPRSADLDWSSPPLDNVPVFWNRLMNPQWGRMLGLCCDAQHPAFAGFPTEENCDWQWTQITKGTRAVNIGKLPRELKPIVAAIDDWNRNWKLAPIFEVKVGSGRLLVCSFDITSKLDERIVARQLRRSLLDYAASEKFQPKVSVTPEQMRGLWFDTLVMRKLGAKAGGDGGAAMDGDPNTFWGAGGGRSGRGYPHELTITFTNPVTMNGVVLMNRQNDRDHLGDIRGYEISTSDDGTNWQTAVRGELASTWNPQTLKFPSTITARHIKLTALSGFGADTSAALAEIAVLYAGPTLPENSNVAVEYQRVRSTSSDVDEGAIVPTAPKPKP